MIYWRVITILDWVEEGKKVVMKREIEYIENEKKDFFHDYMFYIKWILNFSIGLLEFYNLPYDSY